MLKSGQKRPNTPSVPKNLGDPQHWIQGLRETVITATSDNIFHFKVGGGSDNGEFVYVYDIEERSIKYVTGGISENDILLEIQGHKIAGYTQRDVVALLSHIVRTGNNISLKTTKAGTVWTKKANKQPF